MSTLRALLADESGAAMTEYAIIVSLMTGAMMAILIAISKNANSSLTAVATATQNYEVGTPP